ncbi:hypothetical protein BS47DRAFT_1357845 [Hydnum rufescens UP504]|uniref:Uncharacterized protein n=1 Tax=Hydnum rufescens UP504 TaxID=1448309 RepID=A0A9P6B8P0_9AGAM|nr:hypothetical protein BS47DRAFT_1357845 [Hydnum rufescens UP504]
MQWGLIRWRGSSQSQVPSIVETGTTEDRINRNGDLAPAIATYHKGRRCLSCNYWPDRPSMKGHGVAPDETAGHKLLSGGRTVNTKIFDTEHQARSGNPNSVPNTSRSSRTERGSPMIWVTLGCAKLFGKSQLFGGVGLYIDFLPTQAASQFKPNQTPGQLAVLAPRDSCASEDGDSFQAWFAKRRWTHSR